MSFRHPLVRSGDSARLPAIWQMQANTIPRLQWCEYAYGSGSKSRESRAMGDSCESGRPTFSLDKCVRPARVGGVVANTKPDCQEASKRKRPKYVIVNESPASHLSRWWATSYPWREDGQPAGAWAGQCRSAWGRLAPDSQRRSPGPGNDCSNPSSPHAFCGISPWPTLGEPQTFKTGYSLGR